MEKTLREKLSPARATQYIYNAHAHTKTDKTRVKKTKNTLKSCIHCQVKTTRTTDQTPNRAEKPILSKMKNCVNSKRFFQRVPKKPEKIPNKPSGLLSIIKAGYYKRI